MSLRKATLGAVLALASTASLAQAAALPTVTSVAHAHPGGTLPITLRAPQRTLLRLVLSTHARPVRGDAVVARAVTVAAHRTRTLRARVPSTQKPGRYRLLACTRGHHVRCRTASRLTVDATPVSTKDLTDAAVAAGHLKPDRALVFRVWSQVGDPRLPGAYRGDVDAADDSALAEAVAARPKMRRADRQAIQLALLPPIARSGAARKRTARAASSGGLSPRACQAQATSQHWGALTGSHVRVWWWRAHPANRKAAAGLVRLADRVIWPAYAKLMGRTPPSDRGKLCDGGDGHYDIYLLPDDILRGGALRGATLPFGPHCTGGPSFTEIFTHGGVAPPTGFELAHELFHAFQYAFPYQGDCGTFASHTWFDEGSAVWASTWLFPHQEGSHEVPTALLQATLCPADVFAYDSFPLALQLVRRDGAQTIPDIYRAFAGADTLHGIDAAVPGGWAQAWKSFTRDGWNQEADGAPFASWYGIATTPGPLGGECGNPEPRTLGVQGAHGWRHPVFLSFVGSLARRYDDLHFTDDVRQVRIHNGTVGNGRSDLQAFIQRRDGAWQVQDLSGTADTTFCRQTPGQDIQRVVLAYDDHSLDHLAQVYRGKMINFAQGPVDGYDTSIAVDVRDSCAQFFRVTAASGTLDYQAHYPAARYSGDTCAVDGSEHDTMTLDPAGHVAATDGRYDRGTVSLSIPLHVSGAVDYSAGCEMGTGGTSSCHTTVDDSGGPQASALGDAAAATQDVQIGAMVRRGYGCASQMKDAGLSHDIQVLDAAVPTSALSSGEPFQISWDANTVDGSRSIHRTLNVTVTPVTESGTPRQAEDGGLEGKLE